MKEIELGQHEAICQKWEESEKNWGVRPDGFSLHLSFAALKRFVHAYWDAMPDDAPEAYSRPDGTPYIVGVSQEIAHKIQEAGDGLRFSKAYKYPGSGGIDGWEHHSSDE